MTVMGLLPGKAPPYVLFVIIILAEGYFRWVSGCSSVTRDTNMSQPLLELLGSV